MKYLVQEMYVRINIFNIKYIDGRVANRLFKIVMSYTAT